ncbi:diacylglycerol O-acyltransferase 1-like [Pollicipes pollicipes]|uniref:diacylglycerol O-acyltransferase 1-like n=1 Tax=Pollicipes pollicipes TaxID=41117 RepID=UPI00188491E8|nr:diacylglycerol O-acyltransferase 1-like [Pollicipes pollicipes]XP_037068051.1 diacylglycerol O-acyltransferase 1-like [Pollicipes pollicipes]
MTAGQQKGSPRAATVRPKTAAAPQKTSGGGQGARPRLRRTISVGRAEDISQTEQRIRRNQPDEPIHKNCDSLLSWRAEFTEYSGFVNWGFTLLFLGGARLMLENIRKYGLLVDPPQWFVVLNGGPFRFGDRYPSLMTLLYLQVHAWVALAIEKLLARWVISPVIGIILHTINIVMILILPHVVVHFIENIPLVGLTVISMSCVVLALKLSSYAHVNKWCRDDASGKRRYRSLSYSKSIACFQLPASDRTAADSPTPASEPIPEQRLVRYPDNLNLSDLYYYLIAPTLCYELNFPRSGRVRPWFLLRRVLELIVGLNMQVALFQQWIIPSVRNSLEPFSRMDLTHSLERLLKLAIPNHLLWIMMFYLVFHSYLNLVGELTQFGDRRFYLDWWNSPNINTFWRTWNIPVHRFAMRHVYLPLVRHRFSRFSAAVAVFFMSAFLHEYLVAAPLRLLRVWAFLGMMAQIPLDSLTAFIHKYFSPRLGNVIVWMSLIMGQPMAIMMYYHDYIIETHGDLVV